MNNPDLLATLISLAPQPKTPVTKSSPPQPESSSMIEPTSPNSSSLKVGYSSLGNSTTSSPTIPSSTPTQLHIPPTPFRPLSVFDSIPTTSDPATPSPNVIASDAEAAALHANALATRPVDTSIPLTSDTTSHRYKRESAVHRFIAILHLQGVSRDDIATRLGISTSTVSDVLASQNARQFMGAKLEAVFKDQTLERLTNLAEQAVEELEKILLNPDVRAADKLKAIGMVLDRRFGQTTQVVKHVQGDLAKMSDADLLAVIGETSTETIDV